MISFRYYEDKDSKCLELEGHADYALYGFDAVCGMVSVLAQTALYGCKQHAMPTDITIGEGLLKFKCSKTYEKGIAIMDSCAYGIKQVQAQFPECFTIN